MKKDINEEITEEGGITLLALIITIVILLILTGVSIKTINNSKLIEKTADATKIYNEAETNETNTLQEYENILDDINNTQTVGDFIDEIQIGDTIYYEPQNKESYIANDTDTGRVPGQISGDSTSANQNLTAENCKLTNWKVWKIDKKSRTIEIVSTEPTKAYLILQDANGYNNGPEILNSICDKMYSDRDKGINSRSMNAYDIVEKVEEKTNIKYESTEWISSIRSIDLSKYKSDTYNYNGSYYDEEDATNINIEPLFVPNIYGTDSEVNIIGKSKDDINCTDKNIVSGTSERTKFTFRNSSFCIATKNEIDDTLFDIIKSRASWLASRSMNFKTNTSGTTTTIDGIYYNMMGLGNDGVIANYAVYHSGNKNQAGGYQISPIASLSSSTKLKRVNEAKNGYKWLIK